jgi:hypothetical protein
VTPTQAVAVALAGGLALAGAWSLALARLGAREPVDAARLPRLPVAMGGAPLSLNTLALLGLCALGLGYHLLAHAFAWTTLKAPLAIALPVCVLAPLASILVDAFDHARDDPEDRA